MLDAHFQLFSLRGFDAPGAYVSRRTINEEKCPNCGRWITHLAFEGTWMDVGPGSRWTDIIGTMGGVVLHQRVIDAIERASFGGYRAHPIAIREIKGKRLTAEPSPQYYLLEITGQVDINLDELDDRGGEICPLCFARNATQENPYRWNPKRVLPLLETWDGSDFVNIRNWRTGMNFTSKRFIDLANKHKWTNFIFGESLPGVSLWEKPQKTINGLSYHDPKWFEKLSERVKAKHPDLFA